jgi:hypothetical protein
MRSSSLPGRSRRRDAYEPSGAGNLAPRGRVIDKYIVVPAQSRHRRFAQDLPVQIFAARDDLCPPARSSGEAVHFGDATTASA